MCPPNLPPTVIPPHTLSQAMGENLNDSVEGEGDDARQRRLKLIAAVEGDNWSEVIQEQTAETVNGVGRVGVLVRF